MKEERKNTLDTKGTITPPLKEYYPKLVVEKGEVYFLNKETGRMEKRKDYVLGTSRDQRDPVTIGRESPETRGRKDILLPETFKCASRDHCEIFFDRSENAYFLVDYSLNGTLVNGNKVGGNKAREILRLEHEDLIEIPGEKIELRFLIHERSGIGPWIKSPKSYKRR